MNRSLLRTVLTVDAITCSVSAALLSAAADVLAGPLGLPATLLKGAGLSLFPFAAFVGYLARRSELSSTSIWFVIALNALWVVDSALLFAWTAPTALGAAFVVAQALAVLVISGFEWAGLREQLRILA